MRSSAEYCSVVWHESLTQAHTKAIERLQIVGLKIFLGRDRPIREDRHFDYLKDLKIFQLDPLFLERQNGMINVAGKCVKQDVSLKSSNFGRPTQYKKKNIISCEPCKNLFIPNLCNPSHTRTTEPVLLLLSSCMLMYMIDTY